MIFIKLGQCCSTSSQLRINCFQEYCPRVFIITQFNHLFPKEMLILEGCNGLGDRATDNYTWVVQSMSSSTECNPKGHKAANCRTGASRRVAHETPEDLATIFTVLLPSASLSNIAGRFVPLLLACIGHNRIWSCGNPWKKFKTLLNQQASYFFTNLMLLWVKGNRIGSNFTLLSHGLDNVYLLKRQDYYGTLGLSSKGYSTSNWWWQYRNKPSPHVPSLRVTTRVRFGDWRKQILRLKTLIAGSGAWLNSSFSDIVNHPRWQVSHVSIA